MPRRPLPSELFDCDRVSGTLWVGSLPPLDSRLRATVDVVAFTAEEHQPPRQKLQYLISIKAPLSDDGYPLKPKQWKAAVKAAERIRHYLDLGERVLVTCHAGRNRSALVAAMALMMPPHMNMASIQTPACVRSEQAIALVRKARGPFTLSNASFVQHLRSLDGICAGARVAFAPHVFF